MRRKRYVSIGARGIALLGRALHQRHARKRNGFFQRVQFTMRLLPELSNQPDCKYVDAEVSQKYSGAADYFAVASKALVKMRELCPADEFDEDGLMLRGMIVRHLVLPTLTEQSVKVLRFLRDTFGTEIYVSVMGQYFPCHLAKTDARYRALNRRLSEEEYDSVLTAFDELGLENGFCQELSSEEEEYVPSFCLEGIE